MTDHALTVLQEVRERVAPELSAELLKECFTIQQQFQFDRDRAIPLVKMRRLIEGLVESEIAAEQAAEKPKV